MLYHLHQAKLYIASHVTVIKVSGSGNSPREKLFEIHMSSDINIVLQSTILSIVSDLFLLVLTFMIFTNKTLKGYK